MCRGDVLCWRSLWALLTVSSRGALRFRAVLAHTHILSKHGFHIFVSNYFVDCYGSRCSVPPAAFIVERPKLNLTLRVFVKHVEEDADQYWVANFSCGSTVTAQLNSKDACGGSMGSSSAMRHQLSLLKQVSCPTLILVGGSQLAADLVVQSARSCVACKFGCVSVATYRRIRTWRSNAHCLNNSATSPPR